MDKLDNLEEPNSSENQWKRPNDVMKKIRIRKRRTFPATSNSVSQPLLTSKNNKNGQVKDRLKLNPFSKKRSFSETNESLGKKRILSESGFNISSDNSWTEPDTTSNLLGFGFVTKYENENKEVLSNDDLGFVYLNEDSIQGIFTETVSKEPEQKFEATLPPDWSIKTKVRILSPSTFAWCARMRGGEEARSLARSARCDFTKKASPTQSELRVELGSSLVYFQHPSIPWMSLYPRFGANIKILPRCSGEPIKNEDAKSCLYDSWVAGFRSAFQLLCQDLCPYFYVCSQQYTALFISSTVSNNNQISCILTPTSMGFRNSLKTEGINFTMPLQSSPVKQQSMDNQDQPNNDKFVQNLKNKNELNCPFPASRVGCLEDNEISKEQQLDKEDSDTEEELSWRKISDGLQFRQSRDIHIATRNDGLPRTVVLVQGQSDAQMLFNYLLNCRSSISTSGPQSGIPPTIISPIMFLGASMKRLEYRAGIAKITNEDSTSKLTPTGSPLQQRYSLDITGPLLPHHVHEVTQLLSKTQEKGEFTLALGSYMYSAPFNAPKPAGGKNLNGGKVEDGLNLNGNNINQSGINIATNQNQEESQSKISNKLNPELKPDISQPGNQLLTNENAPSSNNQSTNNNISANESKALKCGVSVSFLDRFKSNKIGSTLRQVQAINSSFNWST